MLYRVLCTAAYFALQVVDGLGTIQVLYGMIGTTELSYVVSLSIKANGSSSSGAAVFSCGATLFLLLCRICMYVYVLAGVGYMRRGRGICLGLMLT